MNVCVFYKYFCAFVDTYVYVYICVVSRTIIVGFFFVGAVVQIYLTSQNFLIRSYSLSVFSVSLSLFRIFLQSLSLFVFFLTFFMYSFFSLCCLLAIFHTSPPVVYSVLFCRSTSCQMGDE